MFQRTTLSMIRATEFGQGVNRQHLDNVKRATSNKKAMSESRGDWLPSRGVLMLQMAPNVGPMDVPVAIVRLNQKILVL